MSKNMGISSHFIFEIGFLSGLVLTHLVKLAIQQALGLSWFCPNNTILALHAYPTRSCLFTQDLGKGTQTLMHARQALYQLSRLYGGV